MLTTPRTFGEIARVGPIRRQAYRVSEMLADPSRTGYVAVALPEEMPVNETIELEARLQRAVGLPLDLIVVNGMWPQRFTSHDVTKLRAAERDGLDEGGLAAVRAALSAHERVKAQRAQLRRLEAGTDAQVSTLPFVFESELELDHYRTLSAALLGD
jgi:anion-transporting  ArsA/GET3 family ATPase